MRANRKSLNNAADRAEVGIGTLIVFIAMVLVAAVAAAVLINTSGSLQQKAQRTGQSTTEQVATNFEVAGIYGKVASGKLDKIYIHIQLTPGSSAVDLSKVKLRYSLPDSTDADAVPQVLSENGNAATAGTASVTEFAAKWLRVVNSNTGATMQPGELVELTINSALDYDGTGGSGSANDWAPGTSQNVLIRLIPEVGNPVDASFLTPTSFGGQTYVTIR